MSFEPRKNLIATAKYFYQQGWMLGTAGNLSLKIEPESFWITASGKNKGELSLKDFVKVNLAGDLLESPTPNNRPSAETAIHRVIYNLFSNAKACYHVHSVEANLVSNLFLGNQVELPPLEMIKGFGVWQENPQIAIPLLENYLDVEKIAENIRRRLGVSPPPIPALLIRNHGVTVWADCPKKAQNYIEIVEYIFRYMVIFHQMQINTQF